jgi:serine/threonine protein kinase
MEQLAEQLQEIESNRILVQLAHGRCPPHYRSRWRFPDQSAIETTAERLRLRWASMDICSQPLVVYFLRELLQDEHAARLCRLVDLQLDLAGAIVNADAIKPWALHSLADEIERLAPVPSSRKVGQRGRSISNVVSGATMALRASLPSLKSQQPSRREMGQVLIEGSEPSGIVLEDRSISGEAGSGEVSAPLDRSSADDSERATSGGRDRQSTDVWLAVAAGMRSVVNGIEAGKDSDLALQLGKGPPSPSRLLVASALKEALEETLREASALVAGEIRVGCAHFVHSPTFHLGPCSRFYSLLTCPIQASSFADVRPLGKGGYGQVWCAVKKDSGAAYAVKRMARKVLVGRNAEKHVLDEQMSLRSVTSPFVCARHYAYQTPEELCLVLEWLPGGSLRHHLHARRDGVRKRERRLPFGEEEVRYFAACITVGLSALHAAGIVCRDIKPDNLLLTLAGQLKIVDLGLAQLLGPEETATAKAGTRGYWAPELVSRQPYRFTPDWWSTGVTLYSLVSLRAPFAPEAVRRAREAAAATGGGFTPMERAGGEDDADESNSDSDQPAVHTPSPTKKGGVRANRGGKTERENEKKKLRDRLVLEHGPPPPSEVSEECSDFIMQLLAKAPERRLGHAGGADAVKAHPFFASVDWVALQAGAVEAPFKPQTDAINAGSINEAGGMGGRAGIMYAAVELPAEHFERFRDWDWRDERLQQAELVSAIMSEGVEGQQICCPCLGSDAKARRERRRAAADARARTPTL